jgi:plastocyanin
MHRITIAVLACAALALGACGKDDESPNGERGAETATVTTNPTPAVQTSTQSEAQERNDIVSVTIQNIEFVPHDVTAKVGQKIEWTNEDDAPHNVTATSPEGLFASDTLNKDDTFEYTPTKTGVIDYVCTIHSGQDGRITVTK